MRRMPCGRGTFAAGLGGSSWPPLRENSSLLYLSSLCFLPILCVRPVSFRKILRILRRISTEVPVKKTGKLVGGDAQLFADASSRGGGVQGRSQDRLASDSQRLVRATVTALIQQLTHPRYKIRGLDDGIHGTGLRPFAVFQQLDLPALEHSAAFGTFVVNCAHGAAMGRTWLGDVQAISALFGPQAKDCQTALIVRSLNPDAGKEHSVATHPARSAQAACGALCGDRFHLRLSDFPVRVEYWLESVICCGLPAPDSLLKRHFVPQDRGKMVVLLPRSGSFSSLSGSGLPFAKKLSMREVVFILSPTGG